uniref:Uncharacterized protein n=1 Tax=Arundo donax TaxID=35708 RepID=A0A0A8YY90_ARUDO
MLRIRQASRCQASRLSSPTSEMFRSVGFLPRRR